MTDEIINMYRTTDFATMCVLSYLGFQINGFECDSRSPEKVIVYFNRSNDLDRALESLWSKKLTIEPLAFLEVTRAVKARIRNRT